MDIHDKPGTDPLRITYAAYDGPKLDAPPASDLVDVSEDDYTLFLTLLTYN